MILDLFKKCEIKIILNVYLWEPPLVHPNNRNNVKHNNPDT